MNTWWRRVVPSADAGEIMSGSITINPDDIVAVINKVGVVVIGPAVPKTRAKIDNAVVNAANDLRTDMKRWAGLKDDIDGAGDGALGALGYDAGEITQLRNIAIALGNIVPVMETNEAAFKAVSDIILF